MLQRVAIRCSVTKAALCLIYTGCCSLLQYIAARCSMLRCIAVWRRPPAVYTRCCSVLQYVAARCSMLQFLAVWQRPPPVKAHGVLQCVASCCSVLQCDQCLNLPNVHGDSPRVQSQVMSLYEIYIHIHACECKLIYHIYVSWHHWWDTVRANAICVKESSCRIILSSYMYIYIHIYIYTHTHLLTWIHVYTQTYIYIHTHTYVYWHQW